MQTTLNKFLAEKQKYDELLVEFKKLEDKLVENSKLISTANNRYGDCRKIVTRYEASVFFKMFKLYLWLLEKLKYSYDHSRLKRILNNWRD